MEGGGDGHRDMVRPLMTRQAVPHPTRVSPSVGGPAGRGGEGRRGEPILGEMNPRVFTWVVD